MFRLVCLAFIMLSTTPGQAHAYLDPGVASIVLQGLVATIAAVSATVGLFWHRLKTFFGMGGAADEPSKKPARNAD